MRFDAITKIQDAIQNFVRRKTVHLEVETQLILARLYADMNMTTEVNEVLTESYNSCKHLTNQDQILSLTAIAMVYKSVGMLRKFGFYLRESANNCRYIFPPSKTLAIVNQIAPYYQLESLYPDFNKLTKSSPSIHNQATHEQTAKTPYQKSRMEQVFESGAHWPELQQTILETLFNMADEMGDTVNAMRYVVYMLREVVSQKPSFTIMEIKPSDWLRKIRKNIGTLHSPLDLRDDDPMVGGLGLLNTIQPVIDTSVMMQISRNIKDPLFMYRPNIKSKAEQAQFAEFAYTWTGQEAFFIISIYNPYDETLVLDGLTLTLQPVLFIPDPKYRTRYELDWASPASYSGSEASFPSSHVEIQPRETLKFKLPHIVASVTGLVDLKPNTVVLITPVHLNYTFFNCRFSEKIMHKEVSLNTLLLSSLRYLANVPELLVTNQQLLVAPKEDSPSSIRLQHKLFRGEYYHTGLELFNQSQKPITQVEMELIENGTLFREEDDKTPTCLASSITHIKEQLSRQVPVLYEQSIHVDIAISCTKAGQHHMDFSLNYRAEDTQADIWRKAKLEVEMVVTDGLILESLQLRLLTTELIWQEYAVMYPHLLDLEPKTLYIVCISEISNQSSQVFYLNTQMDTFEKNMYIDPYGTKRYISTIPHDLFAPFVKAKAALAPPNKPLNAKELQLVYQLFLKRYLAIYWKSVANRTGKLIIEHTYSAAQALPLLSPPIGTVSLTLRQSDQLADNTQLGTLSCHVGQLYTLEMSHTCLDAGKMSVLAFNVHHNADTHSVFWVGKNKNMAVDVGGIVSVDFLVPKAVTLRFVALYETATPHPKSSYQFTRVPRKTDAPPEQVASTLTAVSNDLYLQFTPS